MRSVLTLPIKRVCMGLGILLPLIPSEDIVEGRKCGGSGGGGGGCRLATV